MFGNFSCGIHKQKTKTKKSQKKSAKQREKKRKEHSNEETNRVSYNRRVGSLNRHSSSAISATRSKQKKKKKRREQQRRARRVCEDGHQGEGALPLFFRFFVGGGWVGWVSVLQVFRKF
jgi:uncharacterized Zn finger protein (UPF0148 family)